MCHTHFTHSYICHSYTCSYVNTPAYHKSPPMPQMHHTYHLCVYCNTRHVQHNTMQTIPSSIHAFVHIDHTLAFALLLTHSDPQEFHLFFSIQPYSKFTQRKTKQQTKVGVSIAALHVITEFPSDLLQLPLQSVATERLSLSLGSLGPRTVHNPQACTRGLWIHLSAGMGSHYFRAPNPRMNSQDSEPISHNSTCACVSPLQICVG